MKFTKVLLSVAAALALAAPAAQATVLGFEGQSFSTIYYAGGNYGGFNFSGGYGLGSWVIDSNFNGAPHSGNTLAWSNGGTDLWMTGPSFTANSIWVRSGWESVDTTFTGYAHDIALFSTTISANTQFQKVNLNFAGIDKLYISSPNHNLVIDDIEVNAVPEPKTLITILSGLALLAFMRRKSTEA